MPYLIEANSIVIEARGALLLCQEDLFRGDLDFEKPVECELGLIRAGTIGGGVFSEHSSRREMFIRWCWTTRKNCSAVSCLET